MAFVLVQHLSPEHQSILPQLLSRTSAIPVHEARNKMRVEPNQVYVIPANSSMSIARGRLQLGPRKATHGHTRSVDLFLKSLAKDCGERAVGVILSGSDFDGTAGLEAIKAEGGYTFAQDEASAKFESMPRSAAASGCVDMVLPPKKIAEELGRLGPALSEGAKRRGAEPPAVEEDDCQKVLQQLRVHKGIDLSLYRPSTLNRRIKRRMVLHHIKEMSGYARYLREHSEELEALYQDILINVSSFFRDPLMYEYLRTKVFPQLCRDRTTDDPLRIWVAGCSMGQEAYSLAMAFLEFAAQAGTQIPLQIFGTDVNEAMLDKARAGRFTRPQVHEVSEERLRRFFVEENGSFHICKPIRQLCVFARHDLTSDPPFSRMDIVSCRNLLIYFEPPLQKKVIPALHYALKPGGFLVLGSSETIGDFSQLFSAGSKAHKIYCKKLSRGGAQIRAAVPAERNARSQKPGGMPVLASPPVSAETQLQSEVDRILLAKYAPAGVVVNAELEVRQFRGATGHYLEAMPGKASFNILQMAREGLLMPLRAAIQQARKESKSVRKEGVTVRFNGFREKINLEVLPLSGPPERALLILFEPATPLRLEHQRLQTEARGRRRAGESEEAAAEISRLDAELAALREHLQSVTEQYAAANEELQASNEEAHSANEELQSINEELQTTKEELQSTNEELQTVNDEMTSRNLDLHRINNDLNNVFNGVQMCVVVLDSGLRIRRFTPLAEKILNLVPSDLGRPITNIRPNIQFQELGDFLGETIAQAQIKQTEVQDQQGRWHSLRAVPYKTEDNKIEGALLVLVDIDAIKRSEDHIQQALDQAQSTIDTVREPMLVLDAELRVESANRSFYSFFRVAPDETLGRPVYELGNGHWNIPRLIELLEKVLPHKAAFDDFEVEHDFERVGRRTLLLNTRRIPPNARRPPRILLAFEDVTERKAVELLRQSEQRYRTLAESLPQLVWTCHPDGNCDYFNAKYSEYTGVPLEQLLGQGWRESIHPKDREQTCDYWMDALKGQAPYDLEYRIRRADGEFHWFKVRAVPLRDRHGAIVKWFGTSTDIHDQKQAREILERTVAERTARLQETIGELESFSYSVSHDMRAPLRTMLSFAQMIKSERGDQLGGEAALYLDRIINAARRLDQLVQDILTYSRTVRSELRLEPVDLEQLVHETVREHPIFQPPHAEIELEVPMIKVMGHQASLMQCVFNLLSNAVKFVTPGLMPHVIVRTEPQGGHVRVWFEDNGIGIAPEDRDRVFGFFERVHSNDEFEGTGIGLTIVRKAVERMGGAVGVESELGRGSRFWIQLRRAEA
jgi:two-component system, chemotaxis family, CheB/CheR fusion protein